MASIIRQTGGQKTIQFAGADGKRRSVRLGKCSQRDAITVKSKVEQLAAATRTGNPPGNDVLGWLEGLDTVLLGRLAAVGLIPRRQSVTLGEWIAGYVDSRKDVKGSTATVYGHTKRNLIEFFGDGKLIRDITETDGENWRIHLVTVEKLGENTIRKRSQIARQFFKPAVKQKLIGENPFGTLATVVKPDATRFHFISQRDAEAILDKCDPEMTLIFGLARFAGLRIPSELIGLRWIDVDFLAGRFTVHSPKTEHHVGGATRVVPIFTRLRPVLQQAFDMAPDGAEFVFPNCRTGAKNFRKGLTRAIKLAGLTPWKKLFVNLRSSLESELIRQYDIATVSRWLGHTPRVAIAHYAQTLDGDWAKASGVEADGALQKAVQYPAESGGTGQEMAVVADDDPSKFPANSRVLPSDPVTEQKTNGRYWTRTDSGKGDGSNELEQSQDFGDAKSGAVGAQTECPHLVRLMRLWPSLGSNTRMAIMRIADASTSAHGGDPAG